MTLDDKSAKLVAALAPLAATSQRLAWLVEQAQLRPPMPAEFRIEGNRIHGCQARLWFTAAWRDGRCHFHSDSDSLVVKSIAGLICDFYSDCAPGEILGHEPAFLGRLGINAHLTANRRNVLAIVWQQIHRFAESRREISEPAVPDHHAPLRRP